MPDPIYTRAPAPVPGIEWDLWGGAVCRSMLSGGDVLRVSSSALILDHGNPAQRNSLAWCLAQGTRVHIPEGSYSVSTPITLPAGAEVTCDTGATITATSAITTRMLYINGVSGVIWQGGRLVGNAGVATATCFELNDATDCRIEPESIAGFNNKGVAVTGTSTGNLIAPHIVTGSDGTTGAGVSFYGAGVTDNEIRGGTYTGNRIGITINGAHRNRVVAPSCNANTSMGLTIDGIVSSSGDGGRYNEVVGGTYNDNAGSTYGGLYLGNGSSFNILSGVVATGNTGAGLRLSAGSGFENFGNKVLGAQFRGNVANGITATWCPNLELIGVDSSDNTGRGLSNGNADHLKILGGNYSDNTSHGLFIQSGYTKTLGANVRDNGGVGYYVTTGGSADSSNNFIGQGSHVENNTGGDFDLHFNLARTDDTVTGSPIAMVEADAGDADYTYNLTKPRTIIWSTPISALRSTVLGTTNARTTDRVRVVRAASCTGAFNLNVGTGPLKALTVGQWCDVQWDGTAWVLTGFGSL